MRPSIAWLVLLGSLLACGPARIAPDESGEGRPTLGLRLPRQVPASGWESGSWAERLGRDRDRTPLVAARADGSLAPGLAARWSSRTGPGGEPCWRFRLRRGDADSVVRDWSARLEAGDPGLAVALRGVRGLPSASGGPPSGLRAEGDRLWICTARPDPDLPVRLAHPAAWPRRIAGETGPLASVEVDERRGDPPANGAVVVFAREFEEAITAGAEVRRVPVWDGTWALWLGADGRWTADPTFRRWLARAIDRPDLVETILRGHGEASLSLLDDPEASLPEAPAVRPFSAGARPRLTVAVPREDGVAAALASRLKARLGEAGVDLDLSPSRSAPDAVLFLHRPGSTDPSLGLLETLSGLAPVPQEATRLLGERPFEPEPTRRVRAIAVQWDLLSRARLVPLVRAHAGVVGNLDGAEPAPGGRLLRRSGR